MTTILNPTVKDGSRGKRNYHLQAWLVFYIKPEFVICTWNVTVSVCERFAFDIPSKYCMFYRSRQFVWFAVKLSGIKHAIISYNFNSDVLFVIWYLRNSMETIPSDCNSIQAGLFHVITNYGDVRV